MKTIVAGFLLLTLCTNADVLTFDDAISAVEMDSIPDGYGGLVWDNMIVGHKDDAPVAPSGFQNGLVSGDYMAFNLTGQTATVSNSIFDFNGAYFTSAWNNGLNVNIKGISGGNIIYDRTIIVNPYSPTYFNLSYKNIDTLIFDSFGGTDAGFAGSGDSFVMDNFDYKIVPEPAIVIVPVDIKPQLCPNPLNVKSKGVLSVAILGTEIFDVKEIDPNSLEILGISSLRSSFEDVAAPVTEEALPEDCLCSAEGPDGFMDMALKFDTQAIIGAIGPVEDGEYIILTLTGSLWDGTPIEGTDCVWVQKKGKQ